MYEILTIISNRTVVQEIDTSDQHSWISGVLNDVFVSGLPGLVDLPVHPHFTVGHVLFRTSVLWSVALVPMVSASCFPNLF